MNVSRYDRFTRILFLLILVLFTLSLFIIAETPPASGYEISIYAAYPWYLWVFITGIFIFGISVTLYRVFFVSGNSFNSKLLYIWLTILLAYFILFLLPFFRGYPAYGRGDTLSHIGYIKDILHTGKIVGNRYPLSHILVVIAFYMTGIDVNTFVIVLPAFFILLYIVWVGKLGSVVFARKSQLLLVIIFALFLKFGRVQQFSPFNNSLFLLPFFFYVLYEQKDSLSYLIIFAILCISLPFFHILFAITLAIALLVLWISGVIWEKFIESKATPKFLTFRSTPNKVKYVVYILLFITAGGWAIYKYPGEIKEVFSWILHPKIEKSILSQYLDILSKANLTLWQFIYVLWSRMIDTIFFYVSPIILLIVFIFSAGYKNIRSRINKKHFQFFVIYLVFIFLSIVFMFRSDLLFSWNRVTRFVVVSSIIVDTLLIWILFKYISELKRKNTKKVFFIILLSIFCFLIISNIFTVHRSPINLQNNSQVTRKELQTANWWFEHIRNGEKVESRANTFEPHRFRDAIYGMHPGAYFRVAWKTIPDEFGYKHNETLADTFNVTDDMKDNVYMIFTLRDKSNYKVFLFKNIKEKAKTYSDESIEKLYCDYTANKLYSNKECTIWLIRNMEVG